MWRFSRKMSFAFSPEWKSSCRSAFGVSLSISKREHLFCDIAAVLLGIKTALLLDCGHTTTTKFQVLVGKTIIEKHAADGRNCCIVRVHDDILLVNTVAMKVLWDTTTTTHLGHIYPCYVNVGEELGTSCIVDTNTNTGVLELIEGVCSKVWDKLSKTVHKFDTSEEKSSVDLLPVEDLGSVTSNFNLCTLFGRLLGYPVVYWFDPNGGYTLDMVPLVQYTVRAVKIKDFVTDIWLQDCFNQVGVLCVQLAEFKCVGSGIYVLQ